MGSSNKVKVAVASSPSDTLIQASWMGFQQLGQENRNDAKIVSHVECESSKQQSSNLARQGFVLSVLIAYLRRQLYSEG